MLVAWAGVLAPATEKSEWVGLIMCFRVVCCSVVVAVLGVAAPVSAQDYIITDLGTLNGGPDSVAYALNDAGHVVGASRLPPNGFLRRAFLWVDGNMTDLGTLGGVRSAAVGINSADQVVGSSNLASGFTHAFLWEDGQMIDLGTPATVTSEANSINDAGQIVGRINLTAFIWEDGVMTELGTLPDFTQSGATDINTTGEVVGGASTGLFGEARAFHWADGVMTDLGTLPGHEVSGASGINDEGQIVGASGTIIPSVPHAVLWTDGEVIDLGTGPGTRSIAFEVNNAGVIVGYWGFNEQFLGHFATKWEDGELVDLNDVIPADLGWVLHEAYGINEVGQIVGGGFNPDGLGRGFLLTPCAPADFECDGNVGAFDLAQLLAAWGPCPDPDACPADLNADGTVGPFDLAQLLASWGEFP